MEVLLIAEKKQHKLNLPNNWADISAEKMLQIAPALFADTPNNRIGIVLALSPKSLRKYIYQLNTIQVYDLTKLLDWMYTTPITAPHFEAFKVKWTKYILPQKNLDYCVIVEYAFADAYMEAIVNGDSSQICHLIAALCRPAKKGLDKKSPDYDGDPRERFNECLIEDRAALFDKKLTLNEKLYFVLFFTGCKKELQKRYPVLFQNRSTENTKPNYGWSGVIWDMMGDMVNENKMQYANLHNTLAYLVKRHYDNQELIERQKQK